MASIFTRIIQGEIPCYKVAEDDRYFAFLDINPLTEGHTLVVPKKETDYLFAKRIAKRIGEKITCKRVAVVVLGLEVPHAHIHLIPINNEKDVDFHREKLKLSPEEFKRISTMITL